MISNVVKKSYMRLLPLQILGIVVGSINVLIDGIITGQVLGSDAMTAIGLFCPISIAIGISFVITTGINILCCRYIGEGNEKKIVSLFSTGFIFLSLLSILITIIIFFTREPLATLLGAKTPELNTLLSSYILGYCFGIIGQVLAGLFMTLLSFNSDMRRSYIGIGVMIGVNISLDFVFVVFLKLGTFGMGLATSISFIASVIVMFLGYIKKEKIIHFEFCKPDFKGLLSAAYLGLPNVMFTIGNTTKSYLINIVLISVCGSPAVAALNVNGTICSILGSIPLGVSESFLALAGIYYGERDKGSLVSLTKFALKIGLIISLGATGLLMATSGLLPYLFFNKTAEAWDITRQMLLIFPCFLIGDVVYNLFIKCYQCQKKMILVNVMTLVTQLVTAGIAVLGIYLIGANGVWAAYPLTEIVSLLIIAVSVFIFSKKITFSLIDWMKLPKDFGVDEKDVLEFRLTSSEDVVNISIDVISFCINHGLSQRKSNIAGLTIEEMAGNIFAHGFKKDNKEHYVDVRCVFYDNNLTIRIRDDCKAFDPKERINQFNPNEPEKNVGIRLISKLSNEMTYHNDAGINTLLIKL